VVEIVVDIYLFSFLKETAAFGAATALDLASILCTLDNTLSLLNNMMPSTYFCSQDKHSSEL